MNSKTLARYVREAKPYLRLFLTRAFQTITNDVDHSKLDRALSHSDLAEIRAALGITPDGTAWPALEDELRHAFDSTLAPLFTDAAESAQAGAGIARRTVTPDPAIYNTAFTDTVTAF
jgi:hypothetical protein